LLLSSLVMQACKIALLFALVLPSFPAAAPAQQFHHLYFRVTLGTQAKEPASGRVLIFITEGTGAKEVDGNPFSPRPVYIAAKEITNLKPGGSVEVDTDELAYPSGFSELKPGDYQAQAVLDTLHSYNYSGRGPGDLISTVISLKGWTPGRGEEPTLALIASVPERTPPTTLDPEQQKAAHLEDFVSPSLGRFFGFPVHLRAWVVVPAGYDADTKDRYLTVYWTHGFTANLDYAKSAGAAIYKRMADGKMPPMIWVMLDESWATGTHEFANSLNNGPWGSALTNEFIPYLEAKYRMTGGAGGRFLQGHSSGGWATLQLQVNYPGVFGGTWSTSPDPSDFHDFTGVDLYAPQANMYRRADGTPYPLVRDHDKVLGTVEQFAKMERVLGDYGGQLGSFEWVFSPRGADGRPLPMFNRDTGDVDPEVVAYWRDHFDLAHKVATEWTVRGPGLRGKLHVFVGTADTFYLDGAAHKFDAVLRGLNADAHFTYIDNRTHFDLYKVRDDREALFDQIGAEIWSAGHNGEQWKKK
jgi:Putative esterase